MKILLVEDEEELSSIIKRGLLKYGYAVDIAYDGEEAIDYYSLNPYDVIILDLNIPSKDGLEVIRTIRKKDLKTKILILSARSDIADRVQGLDMGANDYLTKPFDFLELGARIRSLIRIAYIQQKNDLSCNGLILNMSNQIVSYNETKIHLTKKEYSILEYMMLHQGEVITVSQFINHIWESNAEIFPDTIKYHIHSLKKKLADVNCNPDIIQNIRGVGYKLEEII
ncbi:response regulator transcription factor [Paenibacillus vulneris]|uniref:Response regulator transcription factor n=1 Tax=Paenibacillus vulneris TaxID=1133364 RepID=A0ABW3UT58_9BACL